MGIGLSRANSDLDCADHGRAGALRRIEVEFEGFFEVGQGLLFGRALAGHVDLETLRDVPVAFTPDGCGERTQHSPIFPYDGMSRRLRRMG